VAAAAAPAAPIRKCLRFMAIPQFALCGQGYACDARAARRGLVLKIHAERRPLARVRLVSPMERQMHAAQMLSTHPQAKKNDALIRCIEDCADCAQTCTACADACVAEDDVAMLRQCIRLCLDCADMCGAMGAMASRQTGDNRAVLKAALAACAAACQACAEECGKHAHHHAHCRICAEACTSCQKACEEAGGSLR